MIPTAPTNTTTQTATAAISPPPSMATPSTGSAKPDHPKISVGTSSTRQSKNNTTAHPDSLRTRTSTQHTTPSKPPPTQPFTTSMTSTRTSTFNKPTTNTISNSPSIQGLSVGSSTTSSSLQTRTTSSTTKPIGNHQPRQPTSFSTNGPHTINHSSKPTLPRSPNKTPQET